MNPTPLPPIKKTRAVEQAEHLFEDLSAEMSVVFDGDKALFDLREEVSTRTQKADQYAADAEAHRAKCGEVEMRIAEAAAALKSLESELKAERTLMSGALYRESMKRRQARDSLTRIQKRQSFLIQREVTKRAKELGRQFYTARGRPKKNETL